MPAEAGDHGADHPVEQRDPVGRDAADVGPRLGLGRGSRHEAEAGVAVGRRQRDGQEDDRERQVEAVGQHEDRSPLPALDGEDRSDVHRVGALPDRQHALDDDEDAERRDRLGQLGGVAERSEDQHVEERAEEGGDDHRDREGGPEAELLAEVDGLREPRERDEELALPQARVRVRHVEGHGAGREVHHPRGAVGDDEGERERSEHAPAAEAEQERSEVVHGGRRLRTSGNGWWWWMGAATLAGRGAPVVDAPRPCEGRDVPLLLYDRI